ncbi:MAG: hypothetical protein F6K24_57715 [Okeania sp. SIO2D1]|nr:hypothetical protein [Okeania sp. SIO2D1]
MGRIFSQISSLSIGQLQSLNPLMMLEKEASSEELLSEIECLRREVHELKQDKIDLEILLKNTTEHSDSIEAELRLEAQQVFLESETRLVQFLEARPVVFL